MAYWWISLIVAVVCSMTAAYIASNKGRSVAGYAILGFILPVIGLIIALVVPSKR